MKKLKQLLLTLAAAVGITTAATAATYSGNVISINIANALNDAGGYVASDDTEIATMIGGIPGKAWQNVGDQTGSGGIRQNSKTGIVAWNGSSAVTLSNVKFEWNCNNADMGNLYSSVSTSIPYLKCYYSRKNQSGLVLQKMTFTNVPYKRYDVIVYFSGTTAHANQAVTFNGTGYYGDTSSESAYKTVQGSSTSWGTLTSPTAISYGVNVLRVDGFTSSTMEVKVPNTSEKWGIAAIQLVDTTPAAATHEATISADSDWTALSWDPDWESGATHDANITVGATSTLTVNDNVTMGSMNVTSTTGNDLTLALADGKTATATTYNFANAVGKTTVSFSTGAAAVSAGKDTVLTASGTGALTVTADKKATLLNSWSGTPSVAANGELVYAGSETLTSVPLSGDTEYANVVGAVSYACPINVSDEGGAQFAYTLTRNFKNGLNLTAKRFVNGNRNASTVQNFTQEAGSTIVINGQGADSGDNLTKTVPVLFAHWPSAVTYTMKGGVFDARQTTTDGEQGARVAFGRDGHVDLTIGTDDDDAYFYAPGIFHADRQDKGTCTLKVGPKGHLILGARGLDFTKKNDKVLKLSGGVLGNYEENTIATTADITLEADSVISNDYAMTISANMKTLSAGTPAAKYGTGTLKFTGDLSAFAPAFTIAEGTVEIDSSKFLSQSATLTINEGAKLVFNLGEGNTLVLRNAVTNNGTIDVASGMVIVVDGIDLGTVTTSGGSFKTGYNVGINDCGKFKIPEGKTADQIAVFDNAGNVLEITKVEGGYVYFEWEITGGACWWDYEFEGNGNNAGTEGTGLNWDGGRPFSGNEYVTDETTGKKSLHIPSRPWRNVDKWPTTATFMMYGTMLKDANKYYVVFGSTTGGTKNTVFLATDDIDNSKVVLCRANGLGDSATVTKLCTMTVPNATSAKHLYAFILKTDDTQSVIDIYLDGELLQEYPFGEVVSLGSGFQIASPHGGEVKGYARPANDDPALLDWLRVYNTELSQAALEKYAVEYPYVSPNGSYQRNVKDGDLWTAEDAWTKEGETPETADVPVAGSTVKIAVDGTTTLGVNLDEDVSYEAIKISGDDLTIALAAGEQDGKVISAGRVTAGANVTFKYDAFTMFNAPLTVKAGKTVNFDLSMVDMTKFFSNQTYDLTGYTTLEDGAAVTFTAPEELYGREITAAIDETTKHYILTVTVPVKDFNYTDGAWMWGDDQTVDDDTVKANPTLTINVNSGSLEWDIDRATINVKGGTLKATAVTKRAASVTVEEGAVLDLNGNNAKEMALTLDGGKVTYGSTELGEADQIKVLTLTDDSEINTPVKGQIYAASYGTATTIALDTYTLTKTGEDKLQVVNTDITGEGTIYVKEGEFYGSEDTRAAGTTFKVAEGATLHNRGGKTMTLAKIIGEGGTLYNEGTMPAFTISGSLKLANAGTFETNTLDNATLDIGAKRGLVFAGSGTINAVLTDAEIAAEGPITVFEATEDATIAGGTVVDKDGKTVPGSFEGGSFQVDHAAKIGTTYYLTLQDALNVGGEVVMLKDATTEVTIPADTTVNLNFGDYAITTTSRQAINNYGTLTIANGNVTAQESAIVLWGNSTTTISGGTYTANDNAVIMGSGNEGQGNVTLTITGGEFNGGIQSARYIACGVYIPNSGTYTISGGTFNVEGGVGVLARAGTTYITGGTFNVTGEGSGWVGDSKNVVPCDSVYFDKEAGYPGLSEKDLIGVPKTSTAKFSKQVGAAYLQTGYETTKVGDYYQVSAIKYAINYELDGGENNPDNPETYTIESPEITLKDPTKEGYTFSGWDPEGVIAAGSHEDKTFTATWELAEVQFTIADVENATKEVEGAELVEGTTYKALPGAAITVVYTANAGYHFGEGKSSVTVEAKAAEDITITTETKIEAYPVKIGEVYYLTLKAANDAAQLGDTITLLESMEGDGIFVSVDNLTFVFDGCTYTVTQNPVGSGTYETQGFHIETANCTLKGGELTSKSGSGVKMLVQNYANLTLKDIWLNGANLDVGFASGDYVLSNNSGNTTLDGVMISAQEDDYAFDTCKYASYPAPTVEVKGASVIAGDIELSGGSLTLTEGTLNGNLVATAVGDGIITKSADFTAVAPEGYAWGADGKLAKVPTASISTISAVKNLDQAYNCSLTSDYVPGFASWKANFVVTFSEDVKAGSLGLAGQYDEWSEDWVPMPLDKDLEANEDWYLMPEGEISYRQIAAMANGFNCGVKNVSQANKDTVMTVKIVLNDGTTEYEIASQDYTLAFNPPTATVTKMEPIPPELDDAYTFAVAPDEEGQGTKSPFGDWTVDFVVSINQAIAADSVELAGSYAAWMSGEWVSYNLPALAADEEYAVLKGFGLDEKLTYAELCDIVKSFSCGVKNLDNANKDAILTVKLVMKKGDETYQVAEVTSTLAALEVGPTPAPGSDVTITPAGENTYVVTPGSSSEVAISNVKPGDTFIVDGQSVTAIGVNSAEGVTIKVTIPNAATPLEPYDITAACKGWTGDVFSTELDGGKIVKVGEEEIPVTPTAIESAAGTIAEGAVATKAIPGLTYTLKRGATIGTYDVNAASAQATTTTITLQDAEPPTDKAFYIIEVTK